jgi:hypothetical protein
MAWIHGFSLGRTLFPVAVAVLAVGCSHPYTLPADPVEPAAPVLKYQTVLEQFEAPEPVFKVAYSGRHDLILTITYDGTVRALRAGDGSAIWDVPLGGFAHQFRLKDVDLDGEEELTVSTTAGIMAVMDIRTGAIERRHSVEERTAPAYGFDIVPGTDRLFYAGAAAKVLREIDAEGAFRRGIVLEDTLRMIGGLELGRTGPAGAWQLSAIEQHHLKGLVFNIDVPDADAGKWIQMEEGTNYSTVTNNQQNWDKTVMYEKGRGINESFRLWDSDGDGDDEILCVIKHWNPKAPPRFKRQWHYKPVFMLIDKEGHTLWEARPPQYNPENFLYYEPNHVAFPDVDGDGVGELVSLFGRNLYVIDGDGELLHYETCDNPHAAHIAASTDGERTDRLILASQPGAMHRTLSVVRFAEPGTATGPSFSDLSAEGDPLHAETVRNLMTINEQASRPIGTLRTNVFVSEVFWTADIEKQDQFHRAQGWPSNLHIRTTAAPRYHGVAEEEFPSFLEDEGILHWQSAGYHWFKTRSPEEIEAHFRAAPRTCRGILFHETFDVPGGKLPGGVRHYLRETAPPLFDLCVRYDKDILMREKSQFYTETPVHPLSKWMYEEPYASRLVLDVEESNSKAPALHFIGRMGLYFSGMCKMFGCNIITDNWRNQKHPVNEHDVLDTSILLRHLVTRAFLGSTEFRIQYRDYFLREDEDGLHYRPEGRQVLETFLNLMANGYIVPSRREDILGLSPVGIVMHEAHPQYYLFADGGENHMQMEEAASGLLSSCTFGLAPAAETYLPRHIMGIERYGHQWFFPTPYGFPLLVPYTSPIIDDFAATVETDGVFVLKDGEKQSAESRIDEIVALYEKHAGDLPFRAEDVFCIGNRLAPDRVRILLCDPRIYVSDDRDVETALRFRGDVTVKSLHDVLRDEPVAVEDGAVEITIPRGAFRILDVVVEEGDGF